MYVYILLMGLTFYALFLQHDPFDLPPYLSDLISYAIIVGSFVGFYRQIEGSLRTDFNNRIEALRTDISTRIDGLKNDNATRLTELKSDFQREIDKLEKRLDKRK